MTEKNTYVKITIRHESIHGDQWILFHGYGTSASGYTSDPFMAHRFKMSHEEVEKENCRDDWYVSIEDLQLEEGYQEPKKNVTRLVEKSTLFGLFPQLYKHQVKPKDKVEVVLHFNLESLSFECNHCHSKNSYSYEEFIKATGQDFIYDYENVSIACQDCYKTNSIWRTINENER